MSHSSGVADVSAAAVAAARHRIFVCGGSLAKATVPLERSWSSYSTFSYVSFLAGSWILRAPAVASTDSAVSRNSEFRRLSAAAS